MKKIKIFQKKRSPKLHKNRQNNIMSEKHFIHALLIGKHEKRVKISEFLLFATGSLLWLNFYGLWLFDYGFRLYLNKKSHKAIKKSHNPQNGYGFPKWLYGYGLCLIFEQKTAIKP